MVATPSTLALTEPSSPPTQTHPIPLSADAALANIRAEMPRLLQELSARLDGPDFPLMRCGESQPVVRLTPAEMGPAANWFFIGDIHGDFFALHTLLRHAEDTCPDGRILFLGDVVDRGDLPFECLFLLLDWGLRHPGRLAWIAGNHDLAFSLDGAGRFSSAVQPAELLDVLNQWDLFTGYRRALGRFLIDLARRLPRAILFPDGLLATHGGFPLRDLHPEGAAAPDEAAFLAWLNTDACLKDFTWTRIHSARRKIPDRYVSGAQYGFTDFEAFCALQPDWFPVKRMITGHEHPALGFILHRTYQLNPALTLLGFGFEDLMPMPEAYRHYRDHLYLGRGREGELPDIISIEVNRGELEMLYPALVPQMPQEAEATPMEPEPVILLDAGSTSASIEPRPYCDPHAGETTVIQE